jgi:hypothetical protein
MPRTIMDAITAMFFELKHINFLFNHNCNTLSCNCTEKRDFKSADDCCWDGINDVIRGVKQEMTIAIIAAPS